MDTAASAPRPISKRIESRADFDLALKSGVGYIYNGPTDAEAKAIGLDHVSYGKLHETKCSTLFAAGYRSKTYFPRLADAHAWLVAEVGVRGTNWSLCSFCYPAQPRVDVELSSAPPRQIASTADFAAARSQGGYIYNGYQADGASGGFVLGKLHDVRCRTLDLSSKSHKTWFATVADAQAWLGTKVGAERREWTRCSICRPGHRRAETDPTPILRQLLGEATLAALGNGQTDAPAGTQADAVAEQTAPVAEGQHVDVSSLVDLLRDVRAELEASQHTIQAERSKSLELERRLAARESEAPATAATDEIQALVDEVTALRQSIEAERASATDLRARLAAAEAAAPAQEQIEQLEGAWQSAIEENYALQDALAAAQAELTREQEHATELQRLIDASVDLAPGSTAQSPSPAALAALYRAVVSRIDVPPAKRLELVDVVLSSADPVPDLLVERGSLLSRLGRHEEAIEQLEAVRHQVGTRAIATPYVASLLHVRRLPDPVDVLDECDWSAEWLGGALIEAAARLPAGEALELAARAGGHVRISVQERLLETLADRQLALGNYQRLIDLWAAHDPAGAAQELMSTVAQGRVQPADPWTAERLLGLVVRAGREDDALAAAQLLLRRPGAANDEGLLNSIVDGVRMRLGAIRVLDVEDEVVRLRATRPDQDEIDRAAIDACDLVRRWQAAGEQGRADAILTFVEALTPRTSIEFRGEIKAQIQALKAAPPLAEPGRVVTTIEAAIRDVAGRFPTLVFLPSAYDTARSAAGSVEKLHRALEMLGEVSVGFAADGIDPYEAIHDGGFKFKPDISDTAKQKYRAAYEVRDVDGTTLLLGPHLDLGNKSTLLRVYFAIDLDARRIVVGHIGDHLPDKSN